MQAELCYMRPLGMGQTDMLCHCRYMYERRASLALGRDAKFLGLPFASEWIRQQGHSMRTAVGAAAGAVGMMTIQQEAEKNLQVGVSCRLANFMFDCPDFG